MRHELVSSAQAQPVSWPQAPAIPASRKPKPVTRYPETRQLPVGAQARLMRAATFSTAVGHPINALLTINAAHMQSIDEGGVFEVGHLWDGLGVLLELARKWVTGRGIFWACIWSREWTRQGRRGQAGEHWHIGIHLPRHLHGDFAKQIAAWTGEAIGAVSPSGRDSAVSSRGAWHLSVRSGRGGPALLAAYLGKAEPGEVTRYGKRAPNLRKPRRDKFGGAGPIQGKRFGISKTLGATEQARL